MVVYLIRFCKPATVLRGCGVDAGNVPRLVRGPEDKPYAGQRLARRYDSRLYIPTLHRWRAGPAGSALRDQRRTSQMKIS
jgi:hypothetical protein